MSFQTKHAPNRSLPDSQSGFTLIELIITITIFGILLAIAIPNLTSLVRNQRVKTAAGDVYASLVFARSEAIKRNANVGICTSGDWATGWSIRSTDCSGTVLKQQDAVKGMSIQKPDSSALGDLIFQRDGRLTATSRTVIVVKSSEDSTTIARCVTVDVSGRPNTKADTDNDSTNGC